MRKGFTLIEMLLYLAILAVVVLALSSFIFLTYSSSIKASTISEVEQQGSQTMSIITQNIRNAASMTSPATGGLPASSFVGTSYTGALLFAQSGNKLQITDGAVTTDITSNRVVVSGLSFQNLSRPSTPGVVRISFTLTHINPSNRGEYIYSKTFTSTASLRWP